MRHLGGLRLTVTLVVGVLVLAAAVVVPVVDDDPYLQQVMSAAAIEAMLAVSLNLVLGYGGLIALSQVAFYGIGAYAAALLALDWHFPFLLTLPSAVLLCAAIAVAFARPILRLRGHYFAIATLVFLITTQLLEDNWTSLTQGTNGLPGIPPIDLLFWTSQSQLDDYFVVLALLLLSLATVAWLIRSPLGRALVATRDDERAAASLGIGVAQVRTIVFGISAGIAGAAGAYYAHDTAFVSSQPFGTQAMLTVLAGAAIGGLGSMLGPVFGAVLVSVLPELLRGFDNWRMVLFGGLVVLVVLVRPDGLAGLWRDAERRLLQYLRRARGRDARVEVEQEVGS